MTAKPWREVVAPHADVASGRYLQAELAADLVRVYRGTRDAERGDEYQDPGEFFRRTFLTEGLRELLGDALLRLSGRGGEPVVALQTGFGGGKTHALLALHHLFGGTPSADLPGVEPLLRSAGLVAAPRAHRAVLVGYELSPGEVHTEPDGTRVRTLWGHLAWQLGGREGYGLVAESDARGVSPGAAVLGELFRRHSPCLVLLDEWVAYARQLVGKRDLPGGDFEAQTTFVQALTEAAKATERTLVVASLPASTLEAGGEHGERALETLKSVLARVSKPWRPATGAEGFHIVRRRLFAPNLESDPAALARRTEVVDAFMQLYQGAPGDFPPGCADETYRRELEASYPIHPELLGRLFEEWSTLEEFQRTRGVLRVLARVIHRLWESGDGSLMILPGSVPLDDGAVQSELTRYLPDVWEPILTQDVDGERSLAAELDRSTPTLGRVSAARRVARTLYIGTAPGAESKSPGMDERRLRLGCVQPGETAAVFGDALRRLSDRAKYVHQDGSRTWISTVPNLNRLAEDRASSLLRDPEALFAEIVRRLQAEAKLCGHFTAVHACPASSAEVPDEPEARLVILSPRYPHRKNVEDSAARRMAAEILTQKGQRPRLARNCLVFLAPDERELDALLEATAMHLAWQSIPEAKSKADESGETVDLRLGATWIHALVPTQPDPAGAVQWEELKVGGKGQLAERTGAKLAREEMLLPELGGLRLRMELDRYLWTETDHVPAGQLAAWFARHLYLPRLRNEETLFRAIQELSDDTFAVAAGWDEAAQRYRGLQCGGGGAALPVVNHATLVVKPLAARRYLEAEEYENPSLPPPSAPELLPNLFLGSVRLDPARIGRDAGRIAEEVLGHLAASPGAEVEVTMQIRIKIPQGVKDDVARTVTENAATLKFTAHSFERE